VSQHGSDRRDLCERSEPIAMHRLKEVATPTHTYTYTTAVVVSSTREGAARYHLRWGRGGEVPWAGHPNMFANAFARKADSMG
jgi:hypothetical protein